MPVKFYRGISQLKFALEVKKQRKAAALLSVLPKTRRHISCQQPVFLLQDVFLDVVCA